jgi:uncharacterized cupredoxin-like copper-binding protein
VLLAGLSTGHMIGLTTVAAIFIAFALVSSFVVPRRRPDFPGRAGLSVFVIASLVLFAGMVTAVEVFGGESETATAAEAQTPSTVPASSAQTTFEVTEKEYRIELPSQARGSLPPGTYTFHVRNTGALAHDLAVQSEGSDAIEKTPLIQPGKDATLTVKLVKGVYDLYCTVPGHRQAGMETKVTVE